MHIIDNVEQQIERKLVTARNRGVSHSRERHRASTEEKKSVQNVVPPPPTTVALVLRSAEEQQGNVHLWLHFQ